jgi:hypothetical protein
MLSSDALDLIAKLGLVEGAGRSSPSQALLL